MVKLLRQTSNEVRSIDDARLARYAYGGVSGVLKDVGNMLGYEIDTTNKRFKIKSGVYVLDGWEIIVDEDGWSLPLNNVSGTVYYSVYAEVNLVTEAANISSSYAYGYYPSIEEGDDLSETPSGIARRVLYQFIVQNYTISGSVLSSVSSILYPREMNTETQKALVSRLTTLSTQLSSGEIVVGKAKQDEEGNPFSSVYAKVTSSTVKDNNETDYKIGSIIVLTLSKDYDSRVGYNNYTWLGNQQGKIEPVPVGLKFTSKSSYHYVGNVRQNASMHLTSDGEVTLQKVETATNANVLMSKYPILGSWCVLGFIGQEKQEPGTGGTITKYTYRYLIQRVS